MPQPELDAFLHRDDSEFIDTLSSEIMAHLDSLDERIYGYTLLTGEDASVRDLIAAYNPYRPLKVLAGSRTYRFDVHEWEMCPRAIGKACDILERLNNEFARLYHASSASTEDDAIASAHVAKLHHSIIAAMAQAKSGHAKLRDDEIFCVFTISDSDLDVDLRASEILNTPSVHNAYAKWR